LLIDDCRLKIGRFSAVWPKNLNKAPIDPSTIYNHQSTILQVRRHPVFRISVLLI